MRRWLLIALLLLCPLGLAACAAEGGSKPLGCDSAAVAKRYNAQGKAAAAAWRGRVDQRVLRKERSVH